MNLAIEVAAFIAGFRWRLRRIRHARLNRHVRQNVLTLFPACVRHNAARMLASGHYAHIVIVTRRWDNGHAWYVIRRVPGNDTLTVAGWARTEAAVDRQTRRLENQARADCGTSRSYSTSRQPPTQI